MRRYASSRLGETGADEDDGGGVAGGVVDDGEGGGGGCFCVGPMSYKGGLLEVDATDLVWRIVELGR